VEARLSKALAGAKPIMKSATRKSVTLWLPFPISTNQIWRKNKRSVYKSDEYKAWLQDADTAFIQQKRSLPKDPIEGKFAASIVLSIERFGTQDCDNSKCLLDAMQRFNLVTNDKNCFSYTITWGEVEGDGCTISVIELPDA